MENSVESVGGNALSGRLLGRTGLVRTVKLCCVVLAGLAFHVACGGSTDGASRSHSSATDGGPDSSPRAGGGAGSSETGGTFVCAPVDGTCSLDSDCCNGWCNIGRCGTCLEPFSRS